MSALPYIVATAGHVDHGKSALVKALTGTDPDRLPEEKARGITIDLGFAHLALTSPGAGSAGTRLDLGLVDVPGHEDFVKNMVAGVGSIDLALFVVAADDGWMPQTEEHLQILSYLGVRRAVVALTKVDLAGGDSARLIEAVREKLRDSPFDRAPVVATSVMTGQGLEELKATLAATLAGMPPQKDHGKPRLSIDRVFTLRGVGTVVTGTLIGGILRKNQPVVIQPSGRTTRIRGLQTHHRDVDSAEPGTRTALNLPDLDADASSADGVIRGQVVTIPACGTSTSTIDVLLEKSSRLIGTNVPGAGPLKDGALVRLHHGTANTAARVLFLDREPLAHGEQKLAQLRCRRPMFLLGGDRFVLRDWPEQQTLAGGVVLDADTRPKQFRRPAQRILLEHRARAPDDVRVWVEAAIERDRAIGRAVLLRNTRFSEVAIAEAASRLAAEKKLAHAGEWLVELSWWAGLNSSAGDKIRAEHREHPERSGLDLNELRRAVEEQLPHAGLFEPLIADLCRAGFVQSGTFIRHSTHSPALPARLQASGSKLRGALSAKPFEPPPKKELVPDALAQQTLRFLLETGEALEVGPELVMLTEHFARARETIRRMLRQQGSATASDLRQALGTSRRVIIPLLERLDRDGITQRQGDSRVLGPRALQGLE